MENEDSLSEPKKIEKVTKGKITRRKKSWIESFSDNFFGDSSTSIGGYILYDVLIPAAKNTISEMIITGMEMLLFGSPRSSSAKRDRSKTHISYESFYRDREHRSVRRDKRTHNFEEIALDTKDDAENVLSSMVDLIEDYGVASVADYYDLIGTEAEYTDHKYGWDNLGQAVVRRVRDGWIIILPRPYPIEN